MKAIEAYQTYLACKQHFSDNSYDYFKYNGKVRVNENTFYTRPDKIFYEKLARKFPDRDEYRTFIALNMSRNPKAWVRELCSREALNEYQEWKGFMESYSYLFSQELTRIHDDLVFKDRQFDDLFLVTDGQYPPLLKQYLEAELHLEFLIGINLVTNCFAHWNDAIDDPIVWPDHFAKATRFAPFLDLDRDKLKAAMRKEFVS